MNDDRHQASRSAPLSSRDLEQLAAFVEGTLNPDDHRHVVDRLGTDEAYYEIFAELREVLDDPALSGQGDTDVIDEAIETTEPRIDEVIVVTEAEPISEAERVSPRDNDLQNSAVAISETDDPDRGEYRLFSFPSFSKFKFPLPTPSPRTLRAAAIFAVGVLGLFGYRLLSYDATYARLLASVHLTSDASEAQLPYATLVNWFKRGGDEPMSLYEPEVAFRLGVLILDLDLALRDGNAEVTASRLRTVRVEAQKSLSGLIWGQPFEALETASENNASAAELRKDLKKARRETTHRNSLIDRDVLAVGTWARACHLAASSGQSKSVLRGGRLAKPPADLDAPWWQDLREAHREAVSSGDLDAIAKACDDILYRGTREW